MNIESLIKEIVDLANAVFCERKDDFITVSINSIGHERPVFQVYLVKWTLTPNFWDVRVQHPLLDKHIEEGSLEETLKNLHEFVLEQAYRTAGVALQTMLVGKQLQTHPV